MISLRSGLCILASTGVSLQKVVPLGIHTNVNTYEERTPRNEVRRKLIKAASERAATAGKRSQAAKRQRIWRKQEVAKSRA